MLSDHFGDAIGYGPVSSPREARELFDAGSTRTADADLLTAVDYMLDDGFLSLGQGVGDRKTVEHAAVIWWRDRYRAKFLRTIRTFGNTWLQDRRRVAAMCRMIGCRAVEYAGDRPQIDLESAMKASADVEKFCVKHAARRHRRLHGGDAAERPEMFAGYWCTLA
jgi:hypothetical protein